MKNKIFLFFCFTAIIISIYFSVPVSAAETRTCTSVGFYIIYESGRYYVMHCAMDKTTISSTWFEWCTPTAIPVTQYYDLNSAIANGMSFVNNSSNYIGNSYVMQRQTIPSSAVYLYNVPPLNSGLTDNAPPPEPPTWYETLWSDFKDFVSDLGLELLTPFDPNSIIDIADWFENAWTVKVGEGEDDLLNQIEVVTPTPVPPSPTPIPYQTVILPDGNGGSIIQYKYLDPSGTPIITDQPPQQNITVNNDNDNNFEYPYYENPENKDNPFKFKIPWYLKLVLKHNDIDIDTLDDHYQVAQNQVQSDEVVNAVNEVYNGFQVLPSDWLLLLGAIASIPLFAALIHRFLQG